MHTLSQSSVPPTLFQDASSWGDLSSFEFFEEADFSPSQHDAGKALQLQLRDESLEQHIDLGKARRAITEPSKVSNVPAPGLRAR